MVRIDVTIPFDTEVMASVPKIGTDSGTNDDMSYIDGLSQNESSIILELIKKPSITYSELAKETCLSRRTVSRVLATLVEKKYIERVGNNKSGYWKIIK